jgi:hypothetical protein
MGRIIRLPGQKVNRLISCVSAYPAELRRRNWNDKLQQIPYRGRTDLPIHIFIRSLLACWKSPRSSVVAIPTSAILISLIDE